MGKPFRRHAVSAYRIFAVEAQIRKYIYKEREKIRKTKQLKKEVLVILEFLVEKGSVVGYILRENIL
jgi:hypothetical protein